MDIQWGNVPDIGGVRRICCGYVFGWGFEEKDF
jgi:hypothetical protein